MAENSKARGANFTTTELNVLVASWLHVSQDPIVGSGQKLGAFWDRTLKHYNDNKPHDRENRNVRSLETKWSDVKRDVAKYAGCFQTVKDKQVSGTSLEDTVTKSKELYVVKDPKGKEFVYIDQWMLLKDCPRFAMTVDDMNQKVAHKKARKQKGENWNVNADVEKENDSPNVGGLIDIENDQDSPNEERLPPTESSESPHFGKERPVGNKATKKLRADESSTKIIAAAQREMATISAKRLKLAESLAEKQDRQRLLTMRVANLDPEVHEYFHMCRAKELRIAILKMQREEAEDVTQLRGALRTPLPGLQSVQVPAYVVAPSISHVVALNSPESKLGDGLSEACFDDVALLDKESTWNLP